MLLNKETEPNPVIIKVTFKKFFGVAKNILPKCIYLNMKVFLDKR